MCRLESEGEFDIENALENKTMFLRSECFIWSTGYRQSERLDDTFKLKKTYFFSWLHYKWKGSILAKISHKSLDVVVLSVVLVLSSLVKQPEIICAYVNTHWLASCCSFVVHHKSEWERGWSHGTPKHTSGREDEDMEESERERRKGRIWMCGIIIIAQWFRTGCTLGPKMYHVEVNRWHSIAFRALLNVVIWARSWVIISLVESQTDFLFPFITLGGQV